jgi:hypothetical protein
MTLPPFIVRSLDFNPRFASHGCNAAAGENSEVMSRLNRGGLAEDHTFLLEVAVAPRPSKRGNRVNRPASFWVRRICGVDAVLRQSRFPKVALSVDVSRYASPKTTHRRAPD